MHESQMWKENCFITLTYDEAHLPIHGGLVYGHFQYFMRRLRLEESGKRIRFFMCGEYGPLNLRPHYHAVLFNHDFRDRVKKKISKAGEDVYDSPELSRLWGKGFVSVQNLTPKSAGYCARYIVDKIVGDRAEEHYDGREPEFCKCSLKPGIGFDWYMKYGVTDVDVLDHVIFDGREVKPPKYYDKLRRIYGKKEKLDAWEHARELDAKKAAPDNTDARRAVREEVALDRINRLTRSDL